MEIVFIQLATILFMAFVVSLIVRAFNQPLVIGYIFAGMIVAVIIEFSVFDFEISTGLIGLFSEFGIAFLLFIVGLHLNPKVIKEIGTSALLIGLGQIILTFLLTFVISSKFLVFFIFFFFFFFFFFLLKKKKKKIFFFFLKKRVFFGKKILALCLFLI